MMMFCERQTDIVAKLRIDSAVLLGLTDEQPVFHNW